jgi:endo-alpha-1,4-polygalactosaminidase (GH114 family)
MRAEKIKEEKKTRGNQYLRQWKKKTDQVYVLQYLDHEDKTEHGNVLRTFFTHLLKRKSEKVNQILHLLKLMSTAHYTALISAATLILILCEV